MLCSKSLFRIVVAMSFGAMALFLSPGMAWAQERPFLVEQSGERFAHIADAVARIGDGQGTIIIAPGRYRQCAVQSAGDVTYRAAEPGRVIFAEAACEDKAAFVLRGRSARIEGLIFERIGVADGNGAGIRMEAGKLDIYGTMFRDSEQGILTVDDDRIDIRIDRSTFQRLGRCDRDLACAHSIYIGRIGRLTVTSSRFEAGRGGHYVKTRAKTVDISNNSFDDSAGRATNYMVDLSNGSVGTITGNMMVQGKDKENWSCFIALAPEGAENASDGLRITGNSAGFVPGLSRGSAFLADWAGARVTLADNQIAPSMKLLERR